MTQNNHQPTEFNPAGGVDLYTEDSQVQPGRIRDGKNISYRERGMASKRPGFKKLGFGSGEYISGLAEYKGALYRVSRGILAQYNPSTDLWTNKGSNLIAGKHSGTCYKVTSNASTQIDTKCAVAADGRACIAYLSYDPIATTYTASVVVLDKSGNRLLDESTVGLGADIGNRNLWVTYNSNLDNFLITLSDSGNTETDTYILSSSNVLSSVTNIVNANGMVSDYMADEGRYITVFHDSSGGLQLQKMDHLGASFGSKIQVDSAGVDGATTEHTAARSVKYNAAANRIFVLYAKDNGGSKRYRYALYDRDLNLVSTAADLGTGTDDDEVDVASVAYSATADEWRVFYTDNDVSSVYEYVITSRDVANDGTLGTAKTSYFRSSLNSEVYHDGTYYTCMARSFLDVQRQEQLFFDDDGDPVDEKLIFIRADTSVNTNPLHKYGFDTNSTASAFSFAERNSGRDLTLPGGFESGGIEDISCEIADLNEKPKANMTVFNDNIYISSGAGYVKKWDGANVLRAGMPDFIEGETPALSAGALTGTFQWALTFSYQDNSGHLVEGPPTFSASTALTSEDADFTIKTLRNNHNYDASAVVINVYRTITNGSTFFLAKQVTNDPDSDTVTVTDDVSDATLQANAAAYFEGDVLVNDEPQGPKQVITHLNRLIYLSTCQFPSSLFYSKEGEGEHVPSVFRLDFNPKDGEVITGGAKFYDVLVVFKKSKIYILQGITGPLSDGTGNDLTIRLVQSGIGCVSPRSISVTQNHLYFNSGRRIWRMDRSFNFEEVGRNMQRLHDTENTLFPDEGFGISNITNDEYLYSFASTTSTPDKAMMLDFEAGAWSPWEGVPSKMSAGLFKDRKFAIGTHDGDVFQEQEGTQADHYRDGQAPIEWEIKTPWHKFDSQNTLKRIRSIVLGLFHRVPTSVDIEVYVDYQESPVDVIQIPSPLDPKWGEENWAEFVWGGEASPHYKINPTIQKCRSMSLRIRNLQNNEHGGLANYTMNVRPHGVLKGSGSTP